MLAGISVRGIDSQFVSMLIVMKNHVTHRGSLFIGSLFLDNNVVYGIRQNCISGLGFTDTS